MRKRVMTFDLYRWSFSILLTIVASYKLTINNIYYLLTVGRQLRIHYKQTRNNIVYISVAYTAMCA